MNLSELIKKRKLEKAHKKVTGHISEDRELFHGFQSNIAVEFQDCCARFKRKHKKNSLSKDDIHFISNEAAKNFLNRWTQF